LEKEIIALRQENQQLHAQLQHLSIPMLDNRHSVFPSSGSLIHTPIAVNEEQRAASRSLLNLASQAFEGSDNHDSRIPTLNTLGKANLSSKQIGELFAVYFTHYHPYLPVLSAEMQATQYFELSPLLYWTIITVASRRYHTNHKPISWLQELGPHLKDLLWETINNVPQNYHVVKALCLLCAWPLPIRTTSADPTMIICGIMVQIAMQFGLHRPSDAQEFSRTKLDLRDEDVKDRMNTWVIVNVCAQNVSTGYGMPQISAWNWYIHSLHLDRIRPELRNRALIAMFIDKITRTLYTFQQDPNATVDAIQRALLIESYVNEFHHLEATIKHQGLLRKLDSTRINDVPSTDLNVAVDLLYLHSALLHLRLTTFFDPPISSTYQTDLTSLYIAVTTYLRALFDLPDDLSVPQSKTGEGRSSRSSGPLLYATNYVMQMVLAAGFTLMKLLNSFFSNSVENIKGRDTFNQTVEALRSMSVEANDLPQRVAEVLVQLWQASGSGKRRSFDRAMGGNKSEINDSLQIKVRCRMSMSLVYDSIWRWKEKYGTSRNLDAMVAHPTQPDGPALSGTTTPGEPSSISSASGHNGSTILGLDGISIMPMVGDGMNELTAWDVSFGGQFDVLGWAVDNYTEMPLFGTTDQQGFM